MVTAVKFPSISIQEMIVRGGWRGEKKQKPGGGWFPKLGGSLDDGTDGGGHRTYELRGGSLGLFVAEEC